MASILTPKLYARQFNRATQSGVIFDDVIRPGLEEPGEVNRHYAICRERLLLDLYVLKTKGVEDCVHSTSTTSVGSDRVVYGLSIYNLSLPTLVVLVLCTV